jgi:hypothetical protein
MEEARAPRFLLAVLLVNKGELHRIRMIRVKLQNSRRVLYVLAVMLAAACTWAWARSAASVPLAPAVILTVDTHRPGNEFEVGAIGLSTETSELTTGRLSAAHYRLVRLMRLLGPSVLRIGANSVDSSWWTSRGEPPPPWATNTVTPTDLSTLHRLLTATGWRVLLGVNFGHFEPARAAEEAREAQEILGPELLGIEIGNEPNGYRGTTEEKAISLRSPTYSLDEYLHEAQAYRQALNTAAPGVDVDGPDLSEIGWLTQMGAAAGMFSELTQHYYPTSTCPRASPSGPQPTVEGLLSPAVRRQENKTLEALAQAGMVANRLTRISETNSIAYCSESTSGSPSFASALWALDWALRAANAGVKGINFNGNLGRCRNAQSQNPICAPSPEAAYDGDVTPQPEYYGLLAASQLEGGRFVPASLIARNPLPNLTTWATISADGTVKIAIDNLGTTGLAQPVYIHIPRSSATVEQLASPSTEASSDVTLGGGPVTSAGLWRPKQAKPLHVRSSLRVIVGPANAVIVTLYRRHSR